MSDETQGTPTDATAVAEVTQETGSEATPSLIDAAQVPEQAGPADEPAPSLIDAQGEPSTGEQPADDGGTDQYADVTLPEGSVIPPEALDDIKSWAAGHKLDKAVVADLVRVEEARIAAVEEARLAQVREWQGEISKDPALGGEHLKRTSLRIQTALKNAPELRTWLKETGYEWNPAVARFLDAVGASSMEPRSSVQGHVPAAAEASSPMFPNSAKQFPEMFGAKAGG